MLKWHGYVFGYICYYKSVGMKFVGMRNKRSKILIVVNNDTITADEKFFITQTRFLRFLMPV